MSARWGKGGGGGGGGFAYPCISQIINIHRDNQRYVLIVHICMSFSWINILGHQKLLYFGGGGGCEGGVPYLICSLLDIDERTPMGVVCCSLGGVL